MYATSLIVWPTTVFCGRPHGYFSFVCYVSADDTDSKRVLLIKCGTIISFPPPSPPTYPLPNARRRAAGRPEPRIPPTGTIRRPPPASYASPDSIADNALPQTSTPFPTIVVLIRARADPLQHTVSAVRTYLPIPATPQYRPRRRQCRLYRDRMRCNRSWQGRRQRNYPPRNRSRRHRRQHLRNRSHPRSQPAQPQPNTPPVVPILRNTPPTDPAAGRSMRCPADPAPHPPDSGGSAQPSPRHRQA